MLQIKTFVFNPWGENTYLIYDNTGETVIIDCGCFMEQEEKELLDFIEKNNLKISYLLNTHLHIDHILGNHLIKRHFGIAPLAHENDEFLIDQALSYANQLGIALGNDPPYPAQYIDERSKLTCKNFEIKIFHIPGHTPGHLVYYIPNEKVLFTGDVLFNMSIGRTDLIYGNYEVLMRGIFQKLLVLPDDTKVFPGHGEPTTIGFERSNNPFLKHFNIN